MNGWRPSDYRSVHQHYDVCNGYCKFNVICCAYSQEMNTVSLYLLCKRVFSKGRINPARQHLDHIRTRSPNLDGVCPSSPAVHVFLFG